MTWSENIRSYNRSEESLRNNYYEDDIINNGIVIQSEDSSFITGYNYINSYTEPHYSTSQSLSTHLINANTINFPIQHRNNTKGESTIKQNGSVEGQVTYKDTDFCDDWRRTSHEKEGTDKSTSCQPCLNLYKEQFLLKTMEKNAKLKRLVKEMIIARQREKDAQNWNNYINELRKKHGTDTKMRHTASLQYVPKAHDTPITIANYCNTKLKYKQPSPFQDLIQDLYNANDNCYIRQPQNEYLRNINKHEQRKHTPFERNSSCYPTSSQGRFIMLERERQKRLAKREYKPFCNTISEENKLDNSINLDRNNFKTNPKKRYPGKNDIVVNSRGTNTLLETCTQTKSHYTLNKEQALSKKICTEDLNQVVTSQENAQSAEIVWKQNSLACIEDKLDNLINSINNFIGEMKTKKCPRLNKHFDLLTNLEKKSVNITKSDSYGMARNETIICSLGDTSSQSTRYTSKISFDRIKHMDENLTKMNNILLKEIGRKNLITLKDSSVGETYRPCSVQISVTIPTKEISTEVTRSLSKTIYYSKTDTVIEEMNSPKREDRRIAIAVNTDPVSLLALLRLSTQETLRRLLSYVPNIDYYYYLSRLQGSQSKAIESDYVCNICGAAFMRPSQLSDHIKKHELGKTRDCCVCRHVLDLPRRRSGLFKCQYCGQRFTRAYCCELHQRSCATRLGKIHDVTSSLMMLR